MMLIIVVLVAVGVYYLVKAQRKGPEAEQNSAMDIVRKRYAAGEISRDEYLAYRDALKGE